VSDEISAHVSTFLKERIKCCLVPHLLTKLVFLWLADILPVAPHCNHFYENRPRLVTWQLGWFETKWFGCFVSWPIDLVPLSYLFNAICKEIVVKTVLLISLWLLVLYLYLSQISNINYAVVVKSLVDQIKLLWMWIDYDFRY